MEFSLWNIAAEGKWKWYRRIEFLSCLCFKESVQNPTSSLSACYYVVMQPARLLWWADSISTPVKRDRFSSVCLSVCKIYAFLLQVFIHSHTSAGLLNFALPPSNGAKNEIHPNASAPTYTTHSPLHSSPRARYLLNNIGHEKMRISKICKCPFYIDKSANNNVRARWSENLPLACRLSRK